MKLFYTDEKQNKKLLGEFANLESAAEAMLKDLNSKFCYNIGDFQVKIKENNVIHFMNKEQKETGYTVEE